VKGCTLSAKKPLAQISLNVGKIRKQLFSSVESAVLVAAISAISILENLNR
jgi:hypothetical protein